MFKASLVESLCQLVGPNICHLVDRRDGWPGLIDVRLSTGIKRFSVHVGQIHSHGRKSYEYRFQNPASPNRPPVTALPATDALLIGIWNDDGPPVLVAAEPEIRFGDRTRFSVLFPERLFREAQQFGWAEPYRNGHGNLHWSFLPPLLPTFIELYQANAPVSAREIQVAAVSSGLVDEPSRQAAARARQAMTRLVRYAAFGQMVVTAYDKRCAMCGLNLGLVSGAHILPVAATQSVDKVWNGLALCENHHRAFDSHRLWVDPNSRKLKIHPHVLKHAEMSDQSMAFVKSTFSRLSDPQSASDLPRPEMFTERYDYFDDAYDWA